MKEGWAHCIILRLEMVIGGGEKVKRANLRIFSACVKSMENMQEQCVSSDMSSLIWLCATIYPHFSLFHFTVAVVPVWYWRQPKGGKLVAPHSIWLTWAPSWWWWSSLISVIVTITTVMTPEDVNVFMIVYQSSPLPLGGDISQAEGERRLKL